MTHHESVLTDMLKGVETFRLTHAADFPAGSLAAGKSAAMTAAATDQAPAAHTAASPMMADTTNRDREQCPQWAAPVGRPREPFRPWG